MKDVHAILSDVNLFKAWLNNFDDGSIVGYTRCKGVDPIQWWLSDMLEIGVEYINVGNTEVVINGEEYKIPDWISWFIGWIDDEYSWYVTKEIALMVLGIILEKVKA
jgi:hypothetical protein